MKHIVKVQRKYKISPRWIVRAFLLAGAFLAAQTAVRADAVDDLRQALPMSLEQQRKITSASLLNRRLTLQEKVKNLQTIGDLRRALALEEWREVKVIPPVFPEELRKIDADMRTQVGTRLTKALQKMIEKGDGTSRLAVANLIAEMGPTIRSIVEGDKKGYARSLTPEVIQLAQDKNLGVRQEALRALGNIFPSAKLAAPILQEALEKESSGPKLLAAKSLGQLIQNVSHLAKPGVRRTSAGLEANQGDVFDTVLAVLAANHPGLKDSDPNVRAQCLRNIQLGAIALADLPLTSDVFMDFPARGRKLLDEEMTFIFGKHDEIAQEIKGMIPVIEALRAQGAALALNLKDPDANVRLAALEALENIGNARIRLKKHVNSVPAIETNGVLDDHGNRALLKKHDALELFTGENLAAITNLLRDPSVYVRRKAVEFLEIIEEAATPALPLLAERLADEDRFVRRSAARAIANIAPDKAGVAVPGLANLLSDPDLGVRRAAAKTLMEMGSIAHAAVPALAKAVVNGDAVARLDAMDALRSIGPSAGKMAVPQLIEVLNYQDHRVRSKAAQVLGSFKQDAVPALPYLRRALGDRDQEVRINANEAILAINQGLAGIETF